MEEKEIIIQEPEVLSQIVMEEIPIECGGQIVVSEHMLDSAAPAYTEEDEISSSGWRKRVVVITGASSGIGEATARRFSLYADVVYNLDLTKGEDDTINFIKTDVTDPDQVRLAFERILEKEGQIDVLINNAGQGMSGSAEGANPEDIEKVFKVNMLGLASACAYAIPYMRDRGRGRIINIASIAGIFPLPFQSFYSASKAAVISYSNALRTEVSPFGIKVSCVLFSEVKTNFTENKIKNQYDDKSYKYRMAKSIAMYESAEQGKGRDPIWVARRLFRLSNVKSPKPVVVFGGLNKWRMFAKRFLSFKSINRKIAKKY